ncbi:MAG: ABC transporter ATP-binding protein, partial [Oscillospiraceae bacterium]|nr:ABC transporter ATP-binding protein [Oscillospiraceae bacterium]
DVYREAGTLQVERKRKYTVLATIPGKLIETVCMSSLLLLIAYKIASGADLSSLVPGLSGFAVAALRLLPRTNSINSHINSITYNRPSLDALYSDLTESDRLDAERQREIEEKRKHKSPKTKSEDIVLDHISYTYPNAAAPVLSDINLRIPHGSSVGIVGTTGAGKTTLVDIILGLLKPQDGTVHYGSLDIHEDYARWQEHIGYIPQNIYLTDESIRKNVALGVPDEEIREADVWRALEHAQLADFVRSLPEGLDTVIGERGVRISGGQRQRIGIARALYRDPEILFFDEATSSLDNETESAVMDAINTIGKSKTIVIVAHLLTTIEKCDLIFRVENGQVQETKL